MARKRQRRRRRRWRWRLMTNDDKSLPGRLGNRSDRLNRSNQIVESRDRSRTTIDGWMDRWDGWDRRLLFAAHL